ncbi:uncharacterized protein LOC132382615 [Hypanus sabinus]|uniref:uncharacterized protein LOC132382615 n=1 Tax=Hypanus sabinus TaxID=79690 RepID=UPI0028C3EE2F|nr:uncharacterized protein LOC132382615 [Hypanus sabinus]
MQMIANSKTLSAMLVVKKCRSIKGEVKPGQGKAQQTQAATHHLGEADGEAAFAYNMFGVEMDEGPPEPYYATVTVGGKDIKSEIDSGATALVIGEETYRRTWGSNLPPIRLSKLQLRTYTEQPIPHLGVLYVDNSARLVIAKGSGPSLLGRDWLRKIRLNWHEIKYAHTMKDSLQRYSDVFRDELGTLKGVTVKLHVNPEAAPRFFKPRLVPYATKGSRDGAGTVTGAGHH